MRRGIHQGACGGRRRRGAHRAGAWAVLLLAALILAPRPSAAAPRVRLAEGTVRLTWRSGAGDGPGSATVTAVLRRPRLEVDQSKSAPPAKPPKEGAPPPGTGEVVREAVPFPLDVPRVEIHQGVLVWRAAETGPEVAVTELEAALENYGTRPRFVSGRPTLLTASGRVGETGEVAVYVTADPVEQGLDFAGRAQISNLAVGDLRSLIGAPEGLKLSQGTLDVFAEFSVENGRLDGGVKVLLEGAEITAEDAGLFTDAAAWLLDGAIELASDRVPRRDAVGTVVPLGGTLSDPQLDLFRAVVAVVRNAFFSALTAGFQSLATGAAGEAQAAPGAAEGPVAGALAGAAGGAP